MACFGTVEFRELDQIFIGANRSPKLVFSILSINERMNTAATLELLHFRLTGMEHVVQILGEVPIQ